jgi:hypothetical protein
MKKRKKSRRERERERWREWETDRHMDRLIKIETTGREIKRGR